jgi:hypothetical protein
LRYLSLCKTYETLASEKQTVTRLIIWLYRISLRLYPRRFHSEFGAEMEAVFVETITGKSGIKLITRLLREITDLPSSILGAYIALWLPGGGMSRQKTHILPSTRWQAFIGTLPFLAFGVVSMVGKSDQVDGRLSIYIYLAFYLLALSGLLVSWLRGFPLWGYSYLGWVVLFTRWWSYGRINGIHLGYYIWSLLCLAVLIALLWTRSFGRVKELFRDVLNDWTRLSLAMYTFIAFVYLIYDENHHPQLLLFMSASTLAIAAGAWFFLRSASLKGRVVSIVGGFLGGNIIDQVCNNTWDAGAYYGLPDVSTAWYMTVFRTLMVVFALSVILLWPAVIGIYRRFARDQAENAP